MSEQGTVIRKSQGRYTVAAEDRTVTCSLSTMLRKRLVYPIADPASIRPHVVAVEEIRQVDPIAIGDVVRFADAGDGTGLITEVLPRKNHLSRRAAGAKPLEQVIVANVDQVVPIAAAAQPVLKWELVDRYLAAAEEFGLPALVCITKVDLVSVDALVEEVQTYERIGYPVVPTSAVSGTGIDRFREALRGRISVFVGKSGVGKTTLLNLIQPGLGQRVSEVSAVTGKGRHTTSHLELFPLDEGGGIVDTPGMREFGLWGIQGADLAHLFPEMRPHVGRCRFGVDCSHTHEPQCAVKEAVAAGEVTERRYGSYLRMRHG